MGPRDVLAAPLTGTRLILRALEDLNTVAANARRQPGVVEEIQGRIDALLVELTTVTAVVTQLVTGGQALELTARRVAAEAQEIVSGGHELDRTGRVLDGHAAQIVEGGQDLVSVARSLNETLSVFRQQLPRVMGALDSVEELETAAETMAGTLEPLQGAAERVGRVTKRLSRS